MHLNKAQAVMRPRNPWEAMDLGVLLARRHGVVLMATWAAVTLPLFALLTLVFWQQPTVAVLIIWWLKPAFERLPLYILANALFANPPSCKASLAALPRLLKPQLLASLTWRRLSLTRSFDLPVLQLEGLSGPARQQRLITLGRNYSRAPTWLTIIGLHIEMALWLGLIALLYLFIPAQLQENWSWLMLLQISHNQWLWVEHLSNLLYVLVLIVWQPIYVACGFTLYLNRRTQLEAWDIELAFRGLAQRLKNPALLLVFALACCLPYADSVFAEPLSPAAGDYSDELGVNDPRLLKQMLTSEQAQHSIKQIVEAPPFKNHKMVKSWHFTDADKTSNPNQQLKMPDWLKNLLNNLSFSVQVLLWAVLAALSFILLWRYRQWLRTFGLKRQPNATVSAQPQQSILGLEVDTESLPEDLIASAQSLWPNDPRAALSLLYRGLLNHLVEFQELPLTDAHTEHEVLAMTADLTEALHCYSKQLTRHWMSLAWAQRLPDHQEFAALCQQWQQLDQQVHSP